MANDRAMTAESVNSVLEFACMKRQRGRLRIEQNIAGRIQEGEVYLQAGQPVFVRFGQLIGQEALNRLMTWHNVRFTLQLDEIGTAPMALPLGNTNGATP